MITLTASAPARQWRRAADIPPGIVFRSASPFAEITWRRESGGCRALPPSGTGRVYPAALIDTAWNSHGDRFVEVPHPPVRTDLKYIARQPE